GERYPVDLAARVEDLRQLGGQTLDVARAPHAQARSLDHEALVPGLEVARPFLQGGAALSVHALELARRLGVDGPEGASPAVHVLAALAHAAAHHAQPLRRVDDGFQAPAVVGGTHGLAVHAIGPSLPCDLDLERGLSVPRLHPRPGLELLRAVPDEASCVVRAEGAAAGQEAHRLQHRGLSLRVRAQEDVQPGMQLHRRVAYVPEVSNHKLPYEDQARTAWASRRTGSPRRHRPRAAGGPGSPRP